jgi:hypothetical protein
VTKMSLEQLEITNPIKVASEETMFFHPNVIEVNKTRIVFPPVLYKPYDTREDFDWFVSGKLDTDSFKGQHIAIWRRQIVGSGDTSVEAERIAKAYRGDDCRPAIVYVPRDEEVDTVF